MDQSNGWAYAHGPIRKRKLKDEKSLTLRLRGSAIVKLKPKVRVKHLLTKALISFPNGSLATVGKGRFSQHPDSHIYYITSSF